jgi:hypothetical protein
MVVVIWNDSEIKVPEGEACWICGCLLEDFDEVTGTAALGYYHWNCIAYPE